MDIKVIIRGIDHTTRLREFAEEKLSGALDRFDRSVLSATMRLDDLTGPQKGGVDKQCSIDVRLRTSEIHIKEVGEDAFATIDVAIDRLRTVVSREVGKSKHGVGEG